LTWGINTSVLPLFEKQHENRSGLDRPLISNLICLFYIRTKLLKIWFRYL
jgi:hypothetical protein